MQALFCFYFWHENAASVLALLAVAAELLLAIGVVVHLHGILLSLALGLLTVNVVQALGLAQLVNLTASDPSYHLLGKLVIRGLSIGGLVFLVLTHGREGCSARQGLMGEAALVLLLAIDLIIGLLVLRPAPVSE